MRQFHCAICNRYFFDNPDWVVSGKSYTERQEKWIFEMCEKKNFMQVAQLADMCHRTVERLFYSHARKSINLPERYAKVHKIGIDEIAHRKGKKDYACVLTDLERGIYLDILPNRRKETLMAHFQSLGEGFYNQIEVVSCDIWKAISMYPKKTSRIARWSLTVSMSSNHSMMCWMPCASNFAGSIRKMTLSKI
ncbi:MAG: transposase [Arenicella sp.]